MAPKISGEGSRHWEAYWRAAKGRGAAVSGDAPGDLFDLQWGEFLETAFRKHDNPRLLDVACGAGVVIDRGIEILRRTQGEASLLCGLDYAASAAVEINRKPSLPVARLAGVAASAHALPFQDESFDIVVSQFGIEYAGIKAFGEVMRIFSPRASAQFIIHYRDGGIDRECSRNAAVLESLKTQCLFETALSAVRGQDLEASREKLRIIISNLNLHLDGEPLAAKQMLSRLLTDIATLVSRQNAYRLDDIVLWLEAMQVEVELYAGRMRAMTECALDAGEVCEVIELMSARGSAVSDPVRLIPHGRSEPAAWLIKVTGPNV
jgi:SAM-dependent methyltransferase